jgi:ribosomal subunit interface protein
MNFVLRAHSVDLGEGTRAYAAEKIGGAVEQVLGREGSKVDVEVTALNHGPGVTRHRVAVHVHVAHGGTPVVTVEDEDIRAAIDVASDKIWRAVKELRQRRRDKARGQGAPQSFVGSNL